MRLPRLQTPTNYRQLLLTVLLAVLLSACSASSMTNAENGVSNQLNSDRILDKFGSYGVYIVRQDERTRVTSLFSRDPADQKITRTLAVVLLDPHAATNLALENKLIRDGASIGITFRNSGWAILKRQLYRGSIDAGQSKLVRELMPDADLSALAIQVYDFDVQRDGIVHRYATIAELHHPDYLTPADLDSQFPANSATRNHRSQDGVTIIQSVLDELHR